MKKEYLSPEVELIDLMSMQAIASTQSEREARDGNMPNLGNKESLGTGGDEMD